MHNVQGAKSKCTEKDHKLLQNPTPSPAANLLMHAFPGLSYWQ